MEPAPPKWPPVSTQLHCVSIWQSPLLKQQAPVGHGEHGFGLHTPPAVQLWLGGIGQAVCVVMVQLPRASQHVPVLPQGRPGVQVVPGSGEPPTRLQKLGSERKQTLQQNNTPRRPDAWHAGGGTGLARLETAQYCAQVGRGVNASAVDAAGAAEDGGWAARGVADTADARKSPPRRPQSQSEVCMHCPLGKQHAPCVRAQGWVREFGLQVALGRKTLFGGQGAAVISVHASVKMSQQAPMEGVQVVGVQTPVAMLVPPASWQICGST